MTFDELCEVVTNEHDVPPAFKLWVRNLRRDRDAGWIDGVVCDLIATEIRRASATLDFAAVAKVLCADGNPAAAMRLCRSVRCECALSLVTTVAMVARHYAKKLGYSDSDEDIECCLRDIENGVLGPDSLNGRLRGRLDYAWFTDASQLDTKLNELEGVTEKAESIPPPSSADAARIMLGLSIPADQKLARIDLPIPEHGSCSVATPTTVDAAGYEYFLTSHQRDPHGWTLDLGSLTRSLPEWVVRGLDASAATNLRLLGTTGRAPSIDWTSLYDRFDRGEI